MKSIILVRHAEPELPKQGGNSHWTDTELSELGIRQAEAVAANLQQKLGEDSCILVSSDLKRASQTAKQIGKAMGLALVQDPDLREYNNGAGVGGSIEELKASAELSSSQAEKDVQAKPEGETWEDFYKRIAAAMDRVLERLEVSQIAIVVAHFGANMHAVSWWLQDGLKCPEATLVAFEHQLTGVTELIVNRQGARTLKCLNDTTHLVVNNIPYNSHP